MQIRKLGWKAGWRRKSKVGWKAGHRFGRQRKLEVNLRQVEGSDRRQESVVELEGRAGDWQADASRRVDWKARLKG